MSLHRHKRSRRLGLPEFVAAVLLVAVVILGIVWWHAQAKPSWPATQGRVLSCTIGRTHHNAQPTPEKVTMTYEYTVGAATYTGNWAGFWPASESPNALPPQNLQQLTRVGRSLVVLYNPDNPGQSRLHYGGDENALLYSMIAGLGVIFAVVFFFRLYPAWRMG